MRRPRLLGSLAAVCVLVPSLALAGVVPVSRNSLLQMEGQVKTDDLSAQKSFTQFGTFHDAISKSGGDVGNPNGTFANGDTSQDTNIDISKSNRIAGDCHLDSSAFARFAASDTAGPSMVHATSELTVIFQITDHAEPFALKGAFDSDGLVGATSHVRLADNSSPNRTWFQTDNAVGTIIGGGLNFDSGSLQLPAGTYTLFADSGSGSSGSGRGDPLSYGEQTGVSFTFSAGQGGSGTAIPLPAAVWPGAVALAGVLSLRGGLTYRRRNS